MGLHVGDKAPEFALPSSEGGEVSLARLRGKKVVLYFYPKDDTPGCTIEACGFRDSHGKFISKFDLNFPLLADEDKTVASAYGSWGEKDVRGATVIGMLRKTSLIDEAGNLQRIWRQVTPEGHADEVLEAIRAG